MIPLPCLCFPTRAISGNVALGVPPQSSHHEEDTEVHAIQLGVIYIFLCYWFNSPTIITVTPSFSSNLLKSISTSTTLISSLKLQLKLA